MATYSSPGKVFLLGEYLVLTGGPALIAAISPRFELKTTERAPELTLPFPSQSPAGLLAAHLRREHTGLAVKFASTQFEFIDPLKGAGGIGASSAAFALLYRWALDQDFFANEPTDWTAAYSLFRKLTQVKNSFTSPSGADVVAQWRGGVTLFEPEAAACREAFPYFNWNLVLVFSTTGAHGFKTTTHTHLNELENARPDWRREITENLLSICENGMLAIERGDAELFGRALNQYGEALSAMKLELPAIRELCIYARTLPGVLGVKGTGALQSDGLVVLVDHPDRRAEVIRELSQRGLRLLTEGLTLEQGVLRC